MYQCITDRALSLYPSLRKIMNPWVEIGSLTVGKLKSGMPFEKYNIDVSIDEVENNESGIKLKYRFVLLSSPTNSKISIEGIASIQGNEIEVNKYLQPDERNIPMVVNLIYQELFPFFYVLTKTVGIPCPAYKISQISASAPLQQSPTPSQVLKEPQISAVPPSQSQIPDELHTEPQNTQEKDVTQVQEQSDEQSGKEPEIMKELEQLVEEQNVSPN